MLRVLILFLCISNQIYSQKNENKDYVYQNSYLDVCEFEQTSNINFKSKKNVFIRSGSLRSNYEFLMSNGLNEKSLIPQNGISLGFGILNETNLFKNKLDINYEFQLDGLHQSYNYYNTSIEWKTYFFSLVAGLNLKLFEIKKNQYLNLGYNVGLSKLIRGSQYFNNKVYDLSDHEEFDGLFFKRDIMVVFDFLKINDSKISIGINNSFLKSLDDNSNQKLNFRNNSLYVKYEL